MRNIPENKTQENDDKVSDKDTETFVSQLELANHSNNPNVKDSSGANTKRCYDVFDDMDDEPYVRPKLQKFITSADVHSESISSIKADVSAQVITTSKSTQHSIQTVPQREMHVPKIETNISINPCGDCVVQQSQLRFGPNKDISAEHTDSRSETSAVDCDGDGVQTLDQNVDDRKKEDRVKHEESKPVVYVHSDQLITLCNELPRIPGRAGMVHSLIRSLGLLNLVQVVAPEAVDEEEVMKFHSRDYIEFLQRVSREEDSEKIEAEEPEQYGIAYDCPVKEGVYECAALVAGATITAARALCEGKCRIAINWCGGWHHAQRSEASGFCYINDIVLGILTLRSTFSRVLYVDLDLHHGDGVENAFSFTPRVMTVSFHKYDTGFFPGSGSMKDVGSRRGEYYTVNVPMKDGLGDAEFVSVFKRVMTLVGEAYAPEAVVCQCGADGVVGDPMESFNLTPAAFQHCVHFLMTWRLPLMLLGGGGYHHANTARCWASLTALTVGKRLPQDVPDHRYFTQYGPDYELTVRPGNRKDHNTPKDLDIMCSTIRENLQNIKGKLQAE